MAYIYKIINDKNNKIYIGQTIKKIQYRLQEHFHKAEWDYSNHKKLTHLSQAIITHGKEHFHIELIEECDLLLVDERERYWIAYYDSYNNGYNSTLGGQDGYKPYKTSEKENLVIIELYKEGCTLKEIGKEFKIDKATVKGILIRHNVKLRTTHTCRLSQYDRQRIIEDVNAGMSRKDIMKKYSISKSYLSQLISGKRRI